MALQELSNVLKAEDARLSRCFDSTQLIFVRSGFARATRLRRRLEEWFTTCDTVCSFSSKWFAVVLPGLDDESGRDAAEALAEGFEGKLAIALCSLPHMRLRQLGVPAVLGRVREMLAPITREEERLKRLEKERAKAAKGCGSKEFHEEFDDEDGCGRHWQAYVLDIAGGVPEDEARVSVEEKNFLFA